MKILILISFFTFLYFISNAQYRTYKNNYNLKSYSYQAGDHYKPTTAAAFAIVPGVGHIYVDQPLRGLIFPAGMIFSSYLMVSGSLSSWASGWGSESNNSGETQIIFGLAGFFGFYIWNFIDVVRIAKIKNLHYRENTVSFQVIPFVETKFESRLNSKIAGISIKVKF